MYLIRDSYTAISVVYGSRRVCDDLCEAGEARREYRVTKIVRSRKIKAIWECKTLRRAAGRPSIIAPNRLNWDSPLMRPTRLGDRHRLPANLERLVVSGSRHRSALAQVNLLIDKNGRGAELGTRRANDGFVAAQTRPGCDRSFRSRFTIRQR